MVNHPWELVIIFACFIGLVWWITSLTNRLDKMTRAMAALISQVNRLEQRIDQP